MVANANSARKLCFLLSDAISFTANLFAISTILAMDGSAPRARGNSEIVAVPRS